MARKSVSVIIPVCNRYHIARENIKNIQSQKHQDLEIIICDDSSKDYWNENKKAREEMIKESGASYFYTALFDKDGNKEYGLGRARNVGVINAVGHMLIFLDERITPANDIFISTFVDKLKEAKDDKKWFFGEKGGNKTSFVENCSAILKKHVVTGGLFCERINKYGGMTREIISRFSRQGFSFVYVPEALCKTLEKSRERERKEKEIPEARDMLRKMGAL